MTRVRGSCVDTGDLGPAGGTAEGANWARVQGAPVTRRVWPARVPTTVPAGFSIQDSAASWTQASRLDISGEAGRGERRVGTIGHPAAVG